MTPSPPCECHALPMFWNKDRRLRAGGAWVCAEKRRSTARAYAARNREARSAYSRAWRLANPDKVAEQAKSEGYREGIKRWRKANPARQALADARWRQNNPEKARAKEDRNHQRRRAAKAGVEHEPYTRSEIFARDNGICHLCLAIVDPDNYHLDHVVPISKGGADAPRNVAVSHPRCNLSKGAKLIGA